MVATEVAWHFCVPDLALVDWPQDRSTRVRGVAAGVMKRHDPQVTVGNSQTQTPCKSVNYAGKHPQCWLKLRNAERRFLRDLKLMPKVAAGLNWSLP